MANLTFKKAVKQEARGRIALIGPAGSGKSYTMLKLATALARDKGGRIAAVDTEHGSLSKYADLFDFDVMELDSYSVDNFLDSLRAAEKAGYAVFCCDSLSHFWIGKDGALEFVDVAKKRSQSRDDMSGWKEFRPHERSMVDAMIASPCHVVVTMRTKTAYEEQVNERTGKKQRIKIGLAPVQREGMEYEMDLVGAMDEDNNLIIDKTRCPFYAGKALSKPGDKDFAPFIEWLRGAPADRPADRPAPPPPPPPPPQHTAQPATVAAPKPAEQPKPAVATPPLDPIERAMAEFRNADKYGRLKLFGQAKKDIDECTGAEADYYRILREVGKVEKCDQFKTMAPASATYHAMLLFIAKVTAEPPMETAKADIAQVMHDMQTDRADKWIDGMSSDIDEKFGQGAAA